ncbi:hypothetical protein PQX77_020212 [Marasmius sp. AFHP31]|nr:hypothetical protein PQX77_020212 [Marasmius sp. AFHP31]
MKRLVGTHWGQEHYATVREHLCLSGYNLDGRQYARDHGHPQLIIADSHISTRIKEPKDLESQLEASLAPLQFAPSSTPSPMDTPVTLEYNNTSTLPLASIATHWARPGFLKKFYDLVSENVTHVDDLDYSVAVC